MPKWYRISLSLEIKCQIGFAVAVLLIIAAGMYLPYKWMDKLVEQGKQEQAYTEVVRILQRHCRPAAEYNIESAPPLIGANEPRPFSRWYLLERDKDEIVQDEFLSRGIMKFKENKEEPYYFKFSKEQSRLYVPENSQTEQQKEKLIKNPGKVMPWNEPSRYLHPLHAKRDCLNCHGAQAIETIKSKIESDNEYAAEFKAQNKQLPIIFSEGDLIGVISVLLPTGQTSDTLFFNRVFIVIGGLLSCICAVVVFYLITQRFILQPVRLLREAADQLVISDNQTDELQDDEQESWQKALEITEKIKTGDEYERLAVAYNQMLGRLKIAHDKLRESYHALDLRLGEMEARNVALYESNKLKSQFLANVSHELRTPLNAIIGFAEILQDQAQTRNDAKAIRYTHNVMESGKLLLRIINDLLDLARLEAGKVELHIEIFSFDEIAQALINIIRQQCEEKSLTINLNINKNIPMIETDAGKVQQILFNLLSNAVKFTPPGGKINIDAKYIEDGPLEGIEVFVTDTGCGIAKEDRDKIFEKFRQLDGSVTRQHGGVGLGLAIVKELLDILGGNITIEDARTKGARFRVFIPIR